MRTNRKLTLLAVAAALGASIACSEPTKVLVEGQLVLYVDTDAPVPAGPGQRPGLATPLFTRLRIEIFEPGADTPCAGCSNEFEMNGLVLAQRRASVGVAPRLDTPGYRARVRLFEAAFSSGDGEPSPDATIDATVALAVVHDGIRTAQTVFLATDDVGRPTGTLAAPLAPVLGAPPAPSRVGTWPGAERGDCASPPPPGAVCVPSGSYWFGNPATPGFMPAGYARRPRLVVLSPFFMSATEVTVAQYRAFGRPAREWTGRSTGQTSGDWCTFTAGPGPFEALPVTCVDYAEARAFCTAAGGDLPTEAQFEYVQGGLVGNAFPWGRDEPSCTEAIYGRAGWGILSFGVSPCKPEQPPGSAAPPGSGTRDRLDLPTGSLLDLAGNVTEWTRDHWNRLDEPCWSTKALHRDPVCADASPTDGVLFVQRGGNWADISARMIATTRFGRESSLIDPKNGFRCVWPGR